MSFIVGFGSTETEFEEAELKAFSDYVRKRYREMKCDYISDKLLADVEAWLDKRAKEFRDKSDVYRTTADYPHRYSYYWPSLTSSASYIVAIFKFSHINRRHGLSPDGWALMQTKRLADIFSFDLRDEADDATLSGAST